MVAISSQSQEQADRAIREWKLPFHVVGDPFNKYVKEMNRRCVPCLCCYGGCGGPHVVVVCDLVVKPLIFGGWKCAPCLPPLAITRITCAFS